MEKNPEMNVYLVLFVLLAGAVPTEVVPARDNLLAADFKSMQSAPPFGHNEDYRMKETRMRTRTDEHTSGTNVWKHHRRRRGYVPIMPLVPPKTKSASGTAGLEKDTDDPDGVYRTLDELKSMKPGPAVQRRDEMPVMSKSNAGDLRRKKRSSKITANQAVRTLKRAHDGNVKHSNVLFSLNDILKENESEADAESMRSHVNADTVSDGIKKSSNSKVTINDKLKHHINMRALHKRRLFRRLEKMNEEENATPSYVSARIQTGPGTHVVDQDVLKDQLLYKTVRAKRKRLNRNVREADSNDRMYDSTDGPPSSDADQWWSKKLDYIDNRKPFKSKQTNNSNADNLDSSSDQRHSAASMRGGNSEDRSQQQGSKQSQQGDNSGEFGSDKKHTGSAGTEGKSDDWLKNELMLIEIESRALKRKAAQLHNKLRRANLNWRQGGSDNGPMYPGDGPRQDVVETYRRLNKRIESDEMPRMGRLQNIQATEHRIMRKHRLPGYSGGLQADIADAVVRLDNDLSDLKAKIISRSGREQARPRDYFMRPGRYRDVYPDAGDHGNYYSDRGRYRRHVAGNHLKGSDRFQRFSRSAVDSRSNLQMKSSYLQTHNCTRGSPCSKQAHIDHVASTVVREQKHEIGLKDIYKEIFSGMYKRHIDRVSNSPLLALIHVSMFRLHWNTSRNYARFLKPGKGSHPLAIKYNIPWKMTSLAELFRDMSAFPEDYSLKYPLPSTRGTSLHVGILHNFIAAMNMTKTNCINMQVELCLLITHGVAPSDKNEVLIVFTTHSGCFSLPHPSIWSRKLMTGSNRKYRQTQDDNKHAATDRTTKRRKPVYRPNLSLLYLEPQKLPTVASDQTQKNMETSAKPGQNRKPLSLYVKRLVRSLQKTLIQWSRLQVPSRRLCCSQGSSTVHPCVRSTVHPCVRSTVHPCVRSTVHPCVVILCKHIALGLPSKHTRKIPFALHHRSHPLPLLFVPAGTRVLPVGQQGRMRASHNGNRLVLMFALAGTVNGHGKTQQGLAVSLQTRRDVPRRTTYFSAWLDKTHHGRRLLLGSRLLVPSLRNNRFRLQSISRDLLISPLQLVDTGLAHNMIFRSAIRNKRSGDPETEISMKEDLDNLFKKFPVSYSEKSMNANLEQAEEAEMASADVGKFILERNKDTESTQDVLSSEARFRRQVHTSGDPTGHKTRIENQRRWRLGAILRLPTVDIDNPRSKQQPNMSQRVRRLPALELMRNKLHILNRNSLDRNNYTNSLQTKDDTGKSTEQATYTSNISGNRPLLTIRKLMTLLETDGDDIPSRLPRDGHQSTPAEKLSQVSFQATSGIINLYQIDIPTSGIMGTPISDLTHTPTSDMVVTPSSVTADMPTSYMTDTPTSYMTDTPTPYTADTPPTDIMKRPSSDIRSSSTSNMMGTSSSGITYISTPEAAVTPISFMPQYALPFVAILGHSNGDKKHVRSLEASTVPGTGLGVDIHNSDDTASNTNLTIQSDEVGEINATEHSQLASSLLLNTSYGDLTHIDNATNATRELNLYNITGHGEVNDTKQTALPDLIMVNASYGNLTAVKDLRNITKDTNAIKLFMAKSSNDTNTEFNKALKTLMTNSSYRSKTVASNQTVNGSRKPDQGQKTLTDYFDNNVKVDEAVEDQDVTVKSTDLQDVDDKVQTEQAETAEGIQLDVKGHKVEPAEPFAFIEKDETKPPIEYQYTWGEWSECSLTCGVGQKFRTNRCGGDLPCTGIKASSETEVCSIKDEC